MKRYTAKPIGIGRYKLGEGPFWDEKTNTLSFVDIEDFCFYRMDEKQNLKSFNLGQRIGAAVPTDNYNEYILAAEDGLYLFDGEKAEIIYDLNMEYQPYQRSNDAKADPKGRLFFGNMVMDSAFEHDGNLYCLEKGEVRILQNHTRLSNGMAWSFDKKKFYFSDSVEHCIFEYDYDIETGNISNRRRLIEFRPDTPDGLCIDSDDNLWIALWGGSRVECHSSKDGSLLAVIDVAATNVTSCCFKGETNTMFITTSGEGFTGEYEGCLFTCDVESTGVTIDRVKLN